jgi:hypothetical protein
LTILIILGGSTVHFFDLLSLEYTSPDIYKFFQGNFAFQRTNSKFSKMAPDQLHEQNNEKIKGAGGAVHLVNREDESGLLKWELCGPELVRMVGEFEQFTPTGDTSSEPKKHHEDNLSYQKKFFNDVQNVFDGMVVNPLKQGKLTAVNNTQIVFDPLVYQDVSTLEAIGQKQFETFWKERLVIGKTSIDEKITKNNILLPGKVKKENDATKLS